MAWAGYNYEAGQVGSLGTLLDYCDAVRIVAEWSTGRRGKNPIVQYRHGRQLSPRKFHRDANLILETTVRYTNSSGAITHADGEAGHVIENLGNIKQLLAGTQDSPATLKRTMPHQGDVTLEVELLTDAKPTQERHVFGWPLRAPRPFWIGAADTGNTAPTLTVGGTAPIDDAVFTFVGGTDAKLVHTASGASIQIVGAMPSGGVIVDAGEGTVTRVSGGADWSNAFLPSKGWWIILDPGANAVVLTGGGTMTADWYTKWR